MLQRLKPGSGLWLLAHECRLFFYNYSGPGNKGKPTRGFARVTRLWVLAALIILHGFSWVILRDLPPLHLPTPALLLPVGGVMLATWVLLCGQAVKGGVNALFQRGDLDLLLSSPIPPQHVFRARLAGIAASLAAGQLILFAPFANVALVLGQPRWLAVYPVVFFFGVLATAFGITLALGLVRLLGVRYAAQAGQILGTVTSAAVFLGYQIYAHLFGAYHAQVTQQLQLWLQPGAVLGPGSVLWWPARAALGQALPLLGLLGLSVAAFIASERLLWRQFAHSTQRSPRAARKRNNATPQRFNTGLFRVAVTKEWRLMRRDPDLITQIGMELCYLLPLLLLFVWGGQSQPIALSVAMLVFFTSSLAASLTWITVAAEDAPDLVNVAPAARATLRSAKHFAAVVPALVPTLIAVVWGWVRQSNTPDTLFALYVLLVAAPVSALCLSLISAEFRKPAPRSHFRLRTKGSMAANILEGLGSLLCAGATYLVLYYG